MTDSGFDDEVSDGRGARAGRSRRPRLAAAAVVVLVLGLAAFGAYAWRARAHSDDLAAFAALSSTATVMDRTLFPLGHSDLPPCRGQAEGVVTRDYPASTGPQAAEVIGFLLQSGWSLRSAAPGADGQVPLPARLSRTVAGAELTLEVTGAGATQLVGSVTGRSPGHALACLGR
ncbi:MAG: hypothetical protein JWP82_2587 [Humibacillus sp.]|nr:hypothetical protein [Humibacillus sp.]